MLALFKKCCCGSIVDYTYNHRFSVSLSGFSNSYCYSGPDGYSFNVIFNLLYPGSSSLLTSTVPGFNIFASNSVNTVPIGSLISYKQSIIDYIMGKSFSNRIVRDTFENPLRLFPDVINSINNFIRDSNISICRYIESDIMPVLVSFDGYPALPPYGIDNLYPFYNTIVPALRFAIGKTIDFTYQLKYSLAFDSDDSITSINFISCDLVSFSSDFGA